MTTKRSFRPAIDALEPRRLMTARLVESEPNGSRASTDVVMLDPADHRAVVSGTAARGDVDWFAMTAANAARLRITRADDEAGILRVDVLVGSRRVREAALGAGQSLPPLVARGGQVVRLRVRAARGQESTYTLAVHGAPVGSEAPFALRGGRVSEVEPNETIATANRVALPAFGPLFIQGTGGAFDLDTFRFRPTRGGLLQIDSLGIAGGAQYLLESDEFPSLVGEFAPLPAGGTVVVPVFRGVWYRLRWVVDSPVPTPYLIRLQVVPPPLGGTGDPGIIPPAVPAFGSVTTGGV
jgi:hypothetical protein